MAKKKRKRLSPELKIKALQDHIIEKQPVSEVCERSSEDYRLSEVIENIFH